MLEEEAGSRWVADVFELLWLMLGLLSRPETGFLCSLVTLLEAAPPGMTVLLVLYGAIWSSWLSSQARSMRRLARDHQTGPSQLLRMVWRVTAKTLKLLLV